MAVIGVAFFAQWSILSSITSSFILFFYHPIRIGHRIKIIDKDYNWVGEVKNITAFYFFIETDEGEYISLPNSLVMQKGLEILGKEKKAVKDMYVLQTNYIQQKPFILNYNHPTSNQNISSVSRPVVASILRSFDWSHTSFPMFVSKTVPHCVGLSTGAQQISEVSVSLHVADW